MKHSWSMKWTEGVLNIPGYQFGYKHRGNTKRGYVGILILHEINFTVREDSYTFIEDELEYRETKMWPGGKYSVHSKVW